MRKNLTYCSGIILWGKNHLRTRKGVCGTTEAEAHYLNPFPADSRFQLLPLAPLIKLSRPKLSVPKEDNSPFANLFCFESHYIFLALLIIKIIKWSDSDALTGFSSGFRVKGLGCVK